MSDTDHDEEFTKAFDGFGEDEKPATPPVAEPAAPPAAAPAPPKVEEPKKDDEPATPPAEPPKKEEATPPADDEKKAEEEPKPAPGAAAPTPPETPEEPKPLTEEGLRNIINDVRAEERTSTQALETTTNEVLEAYYPDGLSNVLVDQATGKELKTPADVVAVTNGDMTTEEATQWLMNEQYKLDQQVAGIKNDARKIAETTLKFKQDGVEVLRRYEPLFKAYPQVQQKVWKQYHKLVKADAEKGVILSAPDMQEFYDTVLEPYQMAFEHANGTSATNPTTPATPPPATPGAEDRLDEGGDGGPAPVDDPNDFSQQVTKELAKPI